MRSGKGRRSRIRRPKIRGRIGSRGSSMGSGIGRRSTTMRARTGRRSPSRTTFRRGGYGTRARPMWRTRGRYPRRYRARPMSSGSCLVCFIFLAIILIIYYAPSFVFIFAPEISSEILMVGVFAIFVIALCFITQAVIDDDDDDEVPASTGDTRVIERETVLVVCPYCSHKNPQGQSECSNCDAAL